MLGPDPALIDSGTRSVIASLATLERAPGSPGARSAAETLARELELRGASVSLEHERVHGTYWVPIGLASALAKLAARVGGRVIERIGGTPAPMWGAAVGPALVSLGAAFRRDGARRLGAALSAGYAAAMWNIAHSPVVPAANDNLSGVAVLLTLAESLARDPCRHLRVLLLSTGSEESFLEGMEAFAARHRIDLPPASTTFLCLESVGSPELMLLSGEGLLRLHSYPQEPLRSLDALAARHGISLRDPFRYRLATDGQVPLRSGYATAVISSIDWYKAPSNYHWPSDRPENLCWPTVAAAARLATTFVDELDRAGQPARAAAPR